MGNPIYKPQQFDASTQMGKMYGTNPSRREKRQFNKYWNSDQRYIDEIAHNKAEHDKMFESANKARIKAGQRFDSDKDRIHTQLANRKIETPPVAPKPIIKPATDWNAIAQQNGFADMEAVKKWQSENGLAADGKFGTMSKAKWNSLQQPSKLVAKPDSGKTTVDIAPITSAAETPTPEPAKFDLSQFAKNNGLHVTRQMNRDLVRWDPDGFGDFWIDSNGQIYEGGSLFDPYRNVNISQGLGYGQRKSRYEALQNAISGVDSSTGLAGVTINENNGQNKSIMRTTPYRTIYKQGGTMNRINYFQQGGAAPQQDIRAQVTALVQAAMQGDQKATQTVNQIMEAAKAGDQQAIQIAQIMEQVIKELQGQATAAKWGAKLSYIRSLKYAKGGKTCHACEKGGIPETADKAHIKSAKKVEEKACGGKAKKKYFGGLI